MKNLYQESVGAYDDEDVPYIVDPKAYTTNIAIEDHADTSNDELPDTSIIIPKKVDKNKKLLIENPPKDKDKAVDSDEDDSAILSPTPVVENIRRPSPIPDVLGTLSAYLLQRKAKKLGLSSKLLKDNEKLQALQNSIKTSIKNKINNSPKNVVQDFTRSFLEKLSDDAKINFYNLLMLLEKDDDPTDEKDITAPKDEPIINNEVPATEVMPENTPQTSDIMNQTPSDLGATYAPGEHSAGELGRIYELKRIFSRLMVLEDYLSISTDNKLAVLKQKVTQAIEFFKLIVSNVDQFLDKIDDIIVMYYDFLVAIYKILKAYLEVVSEK